MCAFDGLPTPVCGVAGRVIVLVEVTATAYAGRGAGALAATVARIVALPTTRSPS